MKLLDLTDVNELMERHEELTQWLSANIGAKTRLFEEKARLRNVLSVRIYNYHKDNNMKWR